MSVLISTVLFIRYPRVSLYVSLLVIFCFFSVLPSLLDFTVFLFSIG